MTQSQKDCYFCNTVIEGFTVKTKPRISYSIVFSVVPEKSHVEYNIDNVDTSTSRSVEATDKAEIIYSEGRTWKQLERR